MVTGLGVFKDFPVPSPSCHRSIEIINTYCRDLVYLDSLDSNLCFHISTANILVLLTDKAL